MNSVSTLHSAAMEYYDLGKIAKAKGNQETYSDYVNKAYVIAMEAALRSQIELSDADPLKAIYLRSVSWLAYDTGNFLEAKLRAEIALSIAPNNYERDSLSRLLIKVDQNISKQDSTTKLLGQIISFNFENNQIVIKNITNSNMSVIQLPNAFFQKIIPFYIGKLVEVELHSTPKKPNQTILKNIRLAA